MFVLEVQLEAVAPNRRRSNFVLRPNGNWFYDGRVCIEVVVFAMFGGRQMWMGQSSRGDRATSHAPRVGNFIAAVAYLLPRLFFCLVLLGHSRSRWSVPRRQYDPNCLDWYSNTKISRFAVAVMHHAIKWNHHATIDDGSLQRIHQCNLPTDSTSRIN